MRLPSSVNISFVSLQVAEQPLERAYQPNFYQNESDIGWPIQDEQKEALNSMLLLLP